VGLVGLISAFQSNEPLTEEQAIKLAEQFIIDNGYTNLPANQSKLTYELFDNKDNIDDMMKNRKNTLHAKAFCISENNSEWHIGFLSTKVNPGKINAARRQKDLPGRAVIVSKDGKGIRMAHKEPLFSRFKKLQ
jgi:hypothetical protein